MENVNTKDGTGMAILAYFIFFLPLILAPKSQLAKYHANQSLVWFIAWIVVWLFGIFVPILGWIVGPIGAFVLLIFWILGIINAAKGEMKPLPFIGKITIIK